MDNEYQQGSYQDFSNRFHKQIQNSRKCDYGLIVVGNSRAGKTTISYGIIGSKLLTHHSDDGRTFVIPSEKGYKDKVLIQNTSVTETPNFQIFPRLIGGKSYAIIDMPGNDDNKKIRQLINFYYIKKMTKLLGKVKFLVVTTVQKNDESKKYQLSQRQLKMIQNFALMFPKSDENSNLLINRVEQGTIIKDIKSNVRNEVNSKIKYQFKNQNTFVLEMPQFKKKGQIQSFSLNLDIKNIPFNKNQQFGQIFQSQFSKTHFYQKGNQKDREQFLEKINNFIKTIIMKLKQDLQTFIKLIFIVLKTISTNQLEFVKNALTVLQNYDIQQKSDFNHNIEELPPIKNVTCYYILFIKDIDQLNKLEFEKEKILKQYLQKNKTTYNSKKVLQFLYLKVKICEQKMVYLIDKMRSLLRQIFKDNHLNKSMDYYRLKFIRKFQQAQFLLFTFSDFQNNMKKQQLDLLNSSSKIVGLNYQKKNLLQNTTNFNKQILEQIKLINANISLFKYLDIQYLHYNALLFQKFKSQPFSQKISQKQFKQKIQSLDYFLYLFKKLQKQQKPLSTSEEEIGVVKEQTIIYYLLQSDEQKGKQKEKLKQIMTYYKTDKLKPHLRKIIMKKAASLDEKLGNYGQSIKIYMSLTLFQQILKMMDRIPPQFLFQTIIIAFNGFYNNAEFNYANECIEKAKSIFFQDQQKSMIINDYKTKLYDDKEMKKIMENMFQNESKINWQLLNLEVLKIKKSFNILKAEQKLKYDKLILKKI